MSVMIMKVTKVEEHPNADNLKVYQFEAPNIDSKQIITYN